MLPARSDYGDEGKGLSPLSTNGPVDRKVGLSSAASLSQASRQGSRRTAGVKFSGGLAARAMWVFAGLVASAVSQWILIVLLARMGPSVLGEYALGLAICAPIIGFTGLALRTVVVTDGDPGFDFGDYLCLRVTFAAIALLSIALVAIIVEPDSAAVILLVGIAKTMDSIGEVYSGLLQRHDMMRAVAGGMILNACVTASLAGIILWSLESLPWAVVGSVAGSIVGSILYPVLIVRAFASMVVRRGSPSGAPSRARWRRILKLAHTSLPLGLAVGIASVSVNMPRYFVDAVLGPSALGVFAVAAYAVVGANMCFAAIAQAVMPRMSRLAQRGSLLQLRSMVSRLIGVSILLGMVALLAIVVAGESVINTIYGATYAEDFSVFLTFGAAAAISGPPFFLGCGISALRAFTGQAKVSMATALGTLIASLYLIERWGLVGAGCAVIVAIIVESLAKLIILRRIMASRLELR
jgi:O-antigen/teichoic acid export membrane protein